MKKANQNWVRLGKNLSTLIVVVTIAIFFYEYKPKKQIVVNQEINLVPEAKPSIVIENDKVINPNTASFDDFLSVGFTEKQAKSCINYRTKGGVFYKEEDVLKIYSITEKDFELLRSHIEIPKQQKRKEKEHFSQAKKENVSQQKKYTIVDINKCDTTELKLLPKIGTFRARKIIEYREKLGGFYSIEQLFAVYSMDSAAVTAISPYVIISTENIKKLNVNTQTFKEINKHPLINFEQTKKIFAYKKIVGTIKNLEELLKNGILEDDEYNILQYYLKTID